MLVELGYELAGYAASAREALEKARATQPDLVLMDIHLEGSVDGTCAAADLHDQLGCSILYLTAFSDTATLRKARRARPLGYLLKPFTMPDLMCALDVARQRHVERTTTSHGRGARRSRAPSGQSAPSERPAYGVERRDDPFSGEALEMAQRKIRLLEQENRDLAVYGAALTHELRNPLTIAIGCTELLEQEPALSPTGLEVLPRIREATVRMQQLTDDVLRLSRWEHQLIYEESLDLALLADKPLRELRLREPRRQVAVEPRLIARGDARLLQIVIDNLLRNAWKFTQNCELGSVKIGRILSEGESTFFVRDNGIGFDDRTSSRLFEPFKRLHAGGPFEGTGVGLFVTSRIIQRHGGRIWAESSPGQGATFYFTLPRLV
jgi:signal transduction histidine kinase